LNIHSLQLSEQQHINTSVASVCSREYRGSVPLPFVGRVWEEGGQKIFSIFGLRNVHFGAFPFLTIDKNL